MPLVVPLEKSIEQLKENEEVAAVISPVLDGAMIYYGMVVDKMSVQPESKDDSETESDDSTESATEAETADRIKHACE